MKQAHPAWTTTARHSSCQTGYSVMRKYIGSPEVTHSTRASVPRVTNLLSPVVPSHRVYPTSFMITSSNYSSSSPTFFFHFLIYHNLTVAIINTLLPLLFFFLFVFFFLFLLLNLSLLFLFLILLLLLLFPLLSSPFLLSSSPPRLQR